MATTEDPFHLGPIWDAILEVYLEFERICKKYNLRFYMSDGNAIGAVRHHGFIPWDDDLDVSMPRPDYERFMEIAPLELPEYFKIVNHKNTPEFKLIFSKIQDCRREKIERLENEWGWQLSNGIFIDIFAIDGFPTSAIKQAWYKFRFGWINRIRDYISVSMSDHHRVVGKGAWLFGGILRAITPKVKTLTDCLDIAEKINKEVPFDGSKMCGRAATTMWLRIIIPTKSYGEPIYFDFTNGLKVPLPHDYHTYLEYDYPNYMQLPPKDKQHPTHGYSYRCPWWLGPTKAD